MAAKHMGTIGNPFSIDQKKQKKGPKILAGLRSARSADGGFHFRHEFTGYEHEPEDHEKATGHEAVQHFIKHMGIEGVELKHKGKAEPKAREEEEEGGNGGAAEEEQEGEE